MAWTAGNNNVWTGNHDDREEEQEYCNDVMRETGKNQAQTPKNNTTKQAKQRCVKLNLLILNNTMWLNFCVTTRGNTTNSSTLDSSIALTFLLEGSITSIFLLVQYYYREKPKLNYLPRGPVRDIPCCSSVTAEGNLNLTGLHYQFLN